MTDTDDYQRPLLSAALDEAEVEIERLRADVERLQAAARKASDELDDIADYGGALIVARRVRNVADHLRAATETDSEPGAA